MHRYIRIIGLSALLAACREVESPTGGTPSRAPRPAAAASQVPSSITSYDFDMTVTAGRSTRVTHVAASRTDKGWRTVVTPTAPSGSGVRSYAYSRIEFDEDNKRRILDSAGVELPWRAMPNVPVSPFSPPLPKDVQDAITRQAASATPAPATPHPLRPPTIELADAVAAAAARAALVKKYGAPVPDGDLEAFKGTRGTSTFTLKFNPRAGGVSEVHAQRTDGAKVDVVSVFDEVRPGLYARTKSTATSSSAANPTTTVTTMAITNIRFNGGK